MIRHAALVLVLQTRHVLGIENASAPHTLGRYLRVSVDDMLRDPKWAPSDACMCR